MSLVQQLIAYQASFNKHLIAFVDEQKQASENAKEIWSHIGDYVLGGGKRLRPFMLQRQFLDFYHHEIPAKIPLAFELLHNSTLVDDDILDGHGQRRGTPTLYGQLGTSSLLMANLLRTAGLDQLVASKAPKTFKHQCMQQYLATCNKIDTAQLLEVKQRGNLLLPEQEYLEQINDVAGYFLGAMLGLGTREVTMPAALYFGIEAYVSAVPDKLPVNRSPSQYMRIGQKLGTIFQLADDLMDIDARKQKGRNLGDDIRNGTPTLMALHAYNYLGNDDRNRLATLFAKDSVCTPDDISWIVEQYKQTGAVEYTKEKILALSADVCQELESLGVGSAHWLHQLCDYAHARQK